MKGCQHLSKYCREGGSLQDAKVSTQTLTPGLAQVSPPLHTPARIHTIFMFLLTMFLLFITEVSQPHSGSSASTKILYFTGKSPTPSMINIPKRLVCVCVYWGILLLTLLNMLLLFFTKTEFGHRLLWLPASSGADPNTTYLHLG